MLSEEKLMADTNRGAGDIAQQALPSHRLRYELLLGLNTMIWGSTFLVVKYAVRLSGPFTYLAFCYGVGSLTLIVIFRKRLVHLTRAELRGGLVLGLLLFAGYACQTVGLQFTTVSKAGFITGLYVPFVPLFLFIFLRQRPALAALAGVLLSFLGLFLLSINNQFALSIGPGELLIFCAAVAFAAHIVFIGKFAPGADGTNLAIVQLSLTSLISFAVLPFVHELHGMLPVALHSLPAQFWLIVVLMGMLDIAYTLLVMNRVQQHLGGVRATLIYALEPLWAALAGLLLAGDVLNLPNWIGCGCILAGMIIGRLGKKA